MKVTKIDIDKSVAKGNLLANLTIVLDYDFELHNIQLLTGKKGEYMNFPIDSTGKFIMYPLNEETRLYLLNEVLKKYYSLD